MNTLQNVSNYPSFLLKGSSLKKFVLIQTSMVLFGSLPQFYSYSAPQATFLATFPIGNGMNTFLKWSWSDMGS